MASDVECVVVGAGVVGLAIARELARAGHEVVVVEQEAAIGAHSSSRNSEVIHAGIYYAPGSLMARLCVQGRERLIDYCATRAVPYSLCGKLIVAVTVDELDVLDRIADRARQNGVTSLVSLTGAEARQMEPDIRCVAALLSPGTGIVDSHQLMLSFQGEAEAAGAMVAFGSPVTGIRRDYGGLLVSVGGENPVEVQAQVVVNSAGLFAPSVAAAIEDMPAHLVPNPYFARGNYFVLSGKSPFSRLVYPVPVPGGLGTHVTLDLAGQARFGPDVEWIERIDYSVNSSRLPRFAEAIRRYWPALDENRLRPGYAGIRPKTAGPNEAQQDFLIQGSDIHGVPGLVNLFGIESPGLTASLAIAAHVREKLMNSYSVYLTSSGTARGK
ncbi:NAD(P)/FAD-dependent oxidoreductase [Mesorhizobium sp. VK9D]|uniref:NAD(P)/FAD-dependent oxidoreductase n=1 Tax=Mesorhizobium australafricanum TaxID=3072311 RepID=UPI002A24A5A4|nr:NAD(P)/FAD-dependent oxidoreductase [Mesorhizobium sp. VK9D]MDX8455999.1 NAD(P)/FAD-dependent oxidoreductase [Mesorhizobium sp. VK9D]